jgi:Lon protease-like protein
MELPRAIPLFPLPNVVLFPGVPLPLHIFEPRYREMVSDAAATHEIIGMVLLRGDGRDAADGNPTIFPVGCAGKIVNLEPLPDGRSNILLHGVREFRIESEVPGRAFRRAEVEWLRREPATLDASSRARLVTTLRQHLHADPDSPAHKVLSDTTLTDEILVNFFSYVLDVRPLEKQALLEEPSLVARAERLREVVEFRTAADFAGLDSEHADRFH